MDSMRFVCSRELIWLREERLQDAKPQANKARITSCLPHGAHLEVVPGKFFGALIALPTFMFRSHFFGR
jgi:hypothetical protein